MNQADERFIRSISFAAQLFSSRELIIIRKTLLHEVRFNSTPMPLIQDPRRLRDVACSKNIPDWILKFAS